MNASACGTGLRDVDDLDNFCQAQFAHAAWLAQGVVGTVESFVSAEGTGPEWRFVVAVAGVGMSRIGVWIGARRSWIGMALVGRLRVSVLYSVHIHIHIHLMFMGLDVWSKSIRLPLNPNTIFFMNPALK